MTKSVAPEYKSRIAYQAILLGGFTALASILLVSGNLATTDAIALRQQEDLMASLNQVVAPHHYENDLLENPLVLDVDETNLITVYRGTRQGQISALAYEISEPGYSGEIRLILGLDANGKILGTRVLSHSETPGLGDKIEEKKDDWIFSFTGLSLNTPSPPRWKVKKDGGHFDAFSGATVTPRAVVKAIKNGLDFFHARKAVLLKPEAQSPEHTDG